MRILIDTNILIPLEDIDNVIEESFSQLCNICNTYGHQLMLHPATLEDLQRDRNINRREIMLSKLKKYPLLEYPPILSLDEEIRYGLVGSNSHDKVDNTILYSIIRSAVHILVTEDRGIHQKAKRLGIGHNVHYVQQILAFLQTTHKIKEVRIPDVYNLPLYQLRVDDPFFDSLRADYLEFDQWFLKKSAEGRMAWVLKKAKDSLTALVIYKHENIIRNLNGNSLVGDILKLCTFKVGESHRGRKIGELLLKKAFEHSIKNRYKYIYITIRPQKHPYLSDMCEDFGFYNFGMCENNRDIIYVKEIPEKLPSDTSLNVFEFYRKYHPFVRCTPEQSKFIVPIRPKYHKLLFPEIQTTIQPLLFGDLPTAGNTIKKAYLSHSKIKLVKRGDLLLFYRSHDKKEITTLGIVEAVYWLNDADEILRLVSKRTVYAREEIIDIAKKETMIILFRQITHLTKPISWYRLTDENNFQGRIQSIRKIDHSLFQKMISNQINICTNENI